MTQPPYRSPEDRPMRRFAIFAAVLTVIVVIGSRPAHPGTARGSGKDFCVCLPSRAGLMLKSMVNRSTVTTVHAASIQRVADEATTAQ
jgi:hypothetical protein